MAGNDKSKSPRDTHGPLVKTGPTRGQNRSRNDDGRWRAKRSDTGSSRKGSGCFLTTAACLFRGLPDDCHELTVLRRFRDEVLLTTREGRALVARYYEIAPAIADRLVLERDLAGVWTVVSRCVQAIESGAYEEATRRYCAMVRQLERRFGP